MNVPVILLAGMTLLGPPSGRPPIGPLERYDPLVYDVTYDVVLDTQIPWGPDDPRVPYPEPKRTPRHPKGNPTSPDWGGTFDVTDTPVVMPIIFRGAYSAVANDSVVPRLFFGSREDPSLRKHFRIDEGLPHHTHLAVIPIARFTGKQMRWSVRFRTQSFNSRIDDAAAARITWPRAWPDEVSDGLTPQMYVESDDEIFAQTVARVSEGKLRFVPPYLAAKDLVRYCINEMQVAGTGVARGRLGVVHGLDVVGAARAAREGRGSPIDLVCVCVAMLKAAGIPARPVIGIAELRQGIDGTGAPIDNPLQRVLVAWAEFYLPDAGWVPFDPNVMRNMGLKYRDVRQPWLGFGSLDHLNERIPLSYHFMPPRIVESPQRPALWGWDPRPGGAPQAEQRITITVVPKGIGVDDPR